MSWGAARGQPGVPAGGLREGEGKGEEEGEGLRGKAAQGKREGGREETEGGKGARRRGLGDVPCSR